MLKQLSLVYLKKFIKRTGVGLEPTPTGHEPVYANQLQHPARDCFKKSFMFLSLKIFKSSSFSKHYANHET